MVNQMFQLKRSSVVTKNLFDQCSKTPKEKWRQESQRFGQAERQTKEKNPTERILARTIRWRSFGATKSPSFQPWGKKQRMNQMGWATQP